MSEMTSAVHKAPGIPSAKCYSYKWVVRGFWDFARKQARAAPGITWQRHHTVPMEIPRSSGSASNNADGGCSSVGNWHHRTQSIGSQISSALSGANSSDSGSTSSSHDPTQVQDLIECFPDEDEHLQKFCQWHPKSMTVKKLVTMMQCPPPAEPWRPRVRERERE